MQTESAFMAAVLLANLAVLVFLTWDVQNTLALLIANVILAVALQWRRWAIKRRR